MLNVYFSLPPSLVRSPAPIAGSLASPHRWFARQPPSLDILTHLLMKYQFVCLLSIFLRQQCSQRASHRIRHTCFRGISRWSQFPCELILTRTICCHNEIQEVKYLSIGLQWRISWRRLWTCCRRIFDLVKCLRTFVMRWQSCSGIWSTKSKSAKDLSC